MSLTSPTSKTDHQSSGVFYCINAGYGTYFLWLTLPWESRFTLPQSFIFQKIYNSGQALNRRVKIHCMRIAMTPNLFMHKGDTKFFRVSEKFGWNSMHTKNLLCTAKSDILSIKFFPSASSSILSAQNGHLWSLHSWKRKWLCIKNKMENIVCGSSCPMAHLTRLPFW